MKLSIVIVNYNVKYFLEQCLYSVLKASINNQYEIIVVDNNSVDSSVEMIREKFPEVVLIANKKNVGFSVANNQAIKISKGEYVLLLNPDTMVEEDTFTKVIEYMDAHPEAGGLGVKMLDGKGNFLPESKRGFPSPAVAFFKIFGFATLFPKSKLFGRYHLGFLDKDEIQEVDVLAGAFMLLRMSVLDEVGLLDETFFMYGEDIDLSYRIIKGGYKNIYFPKTRIIHYKGESTKKSSTNYVFVFYKAMIIFAEKHFSQKNAKIFSLFINLAIYIRASVAILNRFAKFIALPLFDAIFVFIGLYGITENWETHVKNAQGIHYPDNIVAMVLPIYVLFWMLSVYLSGGYDKPFKLYKLIRGIFFGTIFILVVYALLNESYRFSRAVILLGSVWTFSSMLFTRLIRNYRVTKSFKLIVDDKIRIAIVGSYEESLRVSSLLKSSGIVPGFLAYVAPGIEKEKSNGITCLGSIDQLNEIIEIYKIEELIFCAKDLGANTIISNMASLESLNVRYKIAPPESLSIIGSNSINTAGDLYVINVNAITNVYNRRNKRLLDLIFSLFVLMISPILIFILRKPFSLFKNIFHTLIGNYSWVGFANVSDDYKNHDIPLFHLPKIRKGVLTPVDALNKPKVEDSIINSLNMLYAKDYSVFRDVQILLGGFGNICRSIRK